MRAYVVNRDSELMIDGLIHMMVLGVGRPFRPFTDCVMMILTILSCPISLAGAATLLSEGGVKPAGVYPELLCCSKVTVAAIQALVS